MKNLFLIAIVFLIFSCNKKNEEVPSQQTESQDSLVIEQDSAEKWVSKNQGFLDKFKTLELDSIGFTSPEYDDKLGISLTKEDLKLFPKSMNWESFSADNQFETVGKFNIDKNTIGIVLRTPSEYSFSSLKLFFYDKNKEEISSKHLELADQWGDAGYSEEVKSWLYRDEKGNLKSFLHLYRDLQKIEAPDPTKPFTTNEYFEIEISPEKLDTARISKADLAKFRKLTGKK